MKNLPYEIITQQILQETSARAQTSQRLRMNYNIHELEDGVQRMINAIEPGSYVQPHRHLDPPKVECFLVLKGSFAIIIFNDEGEIREIVRCHRDGDVGVDIKPGVWHTVVSLQKGTICIEFKNGPYQAMKDRDFAPWAPPAEDPNHKKYLENLQALA